MKFDEYECFVLLCALGEYRKDSVDEWFSLPNGDLVSMDELQKKLQEVISGES